MKYDDMSWHLNEEFPESSPEDFAAIHIALYLKWCFIQGWAGQLHTDDDFGKSGIGELLSGEITATRFFIDYCDGKLTDEDFDEKGNLFSEYVYGDSALYLGDYGS